MKAICPADASHARFVTTVHVMAEWLVDAHGEFVESMNTLETTQEPDAGNLWTCFECGAEAEVES